MAEFGSLTICSLGLITATGGLFFLVATRAGQIKQHSLSSSQNHGHCDHFEYRNLTGLLVDIGFYKYII